MGKWDEEIKRKALAGIALTNPTAETQKLYDNYKSQAQAAPATNAAATQGITYKPSGTTLQGANYGKTTQGVTGQTQYNPIGTITASPTASNIQLTDDMVKEIANKAAKGMPLTNWSAQKQELYNSYKNPAPTYQSPSYIDYTGGSAPTYDNQYDARIQDALNELLGKTGNFSYNYKDDPLWQQYKESYQREGDRALENTMAQATAQTGGRMNSNAINVGQQAQNYYNAQMNDKIPELEQYAYQKYLDDLAAGRSNISTMQGLEAQDYAKYQDQLAQFNTDRAFNYQATQDKNNWNYQTTKDLNDYNYKNYRDTQAYDRNVIESDRNYDYNLWQAQNALSQDKRNYDYQVSRDSVADQQWQKNFDEGVSEFNQNMQYNKDRAAAADAQWQKQYDYQMGRDRNSDSKWAQEFAANQKQQAYENALNDYITQQQYGPNGTKRNSSSNSNSSGTTGQTSKNFSVYNSQIKSLLGSASTPADREAIRQQLVQWLKNGNINEADYETIYDSNMLDAEYDNKLY